MTPSRHQSGVILLDTVCGLIILGILLGVMATAVSKHAYMSHTLETQRGLDRLAEGVLTDLQQGVAPVVQAWETEVEPTYTLHQLASPGPADGWVWIEVAVSFESHRRSVIGPVPTTSVSIHGGAP